MRKQTTRFFCSLNSCRALVDTRHYTVVTFEGLQGQLLLGLDSLLSHLLDFAGEHNLGLGGTVDTVGLDGDDDTTLVLEEHVGVQADDTGLVGLGNIGEDDVDHGNEHAVAERVSGVLDNGDDVGAVGGHTDQVTAGTVRELNSVDVTGRADDIGNVGDGGTAGGTEIQDLGARAHVDVIETTQDTGSQLGTEGVPDTVLGLGHSTILLGGRLDGNALLTVDSFSGSKVLGDEQIFLTTTGNEDTGVTVGLLRRGCQLTDSFRRESKGNTYDDDLGTTSGTASTTAATTTGTTATTGSATAATATTTGTTTTTATATETA